MRFWVPEPVAVEWVEQVHAVTVRLEHLLFQRLAEVILKRDRAALLFHEKEHVVDPGEVLFQHTADRLQELRAAHGPHQFGQGLERGGQGAVVGSGRR